MRRNERPTWSFGDMLYHTGLEQWMRTGQNGDLTVDESIGNFCGAYARKIKRKASK
jgi:hypothetical protein